MHFFVLKSFLLLFLLFVQQFRDKFGASLKSINTLEYYGLERGSTISLFTSIRSPFSGQLKTFGRLASEKKLVYHQLAQNCRINNRTTEQQTTRSIDNKTVVPTTSDRSRRIKTDDNNNDFDEEEETVSDKGIIIVIFVTKTAINNNNSYAINYFLALLQLLL